jgi:hypothetical protein
MNVWVGLIVVLLGILGVIGSCWGGWVVEHDTYMSSTPLALLVAVGGSLVALLFVVLGIGLMTGADGPTVIEGACYRAVAHNSYVPVNTGKVTIIVPMRDVDLIQITCP